MSRLERLIPTTRNAIIPITPWALFYAYLLRKYAYLLRKYAYLLWKYAYLLCKYACTRSLLSYLLLEVYFWQRYLGCAVETLFG